MTQLPPESNEGQQSPYAPPAAPEQPTQQTQPAQPQPTQPQWAWVQPPTQLVPVQTEPLDYHRLYRGAPKYAWWKPLVVLVLAASIYFALAIGFSLALAPLLHVFDPDYINNAVLGGVTPLLDTQHPWSLVLNMGSIILMIPAVILAMLALGIRPTGRVWSVAGRIRWGLLGRTLGSALLAVIVMNGVGILVGILMTGGNPPAEVASTEQSEFNVTAAVISIVLVLLLVPFQAAAEEVVFRGLFLQVLGSWMRSPWIAIVLSTLAFASMHIYDIWGLVGVGMMGFVAAWLTWKTGGLEAAIAIHILNNVAAFMFMASGITGETGQVESSGGPELLISEAVGLTLFAWLVLRTFKARGYGRQRIDIVYRAVPVGQTGPTLPGTPGQGLA